MVDAHEEEFLRGIVGVVALVVVAHGRRADFLALVIHARAELRIANRKTRLEVDLLHPVDRIVELVGRDQVAVLAVERIDDAVTIGVGQKLALLAALSVCSESIMTLTPA